MSTPQRYYDQGLLILDIAPAPKPIRREMGNVLVKCDATSTGVFPYLMKDGKIRREARRPQEVFSKKSMQSLAGVPFVIGHNYDGISPQTIERVTAGTAGENVEALQSSESGQGVLRTTVNIFDQAAIARMDAGEVEVSCGYSARFIPEPGTLNGEQYDGYQDEITYFEIAQVKDGRMNYGLDRPAVRLLTDSADAAVQITKPRPQERPTMPQKVKLQFSPPGKRGKILTFDEVDPELADLVLGMVSAMQGKEPDGDEAAPGHMADADPAAPGDPGEVTLEMFKKLEAELAQVKEMMAKGGKADMDAPMAPGEAKDKADADAPPPGGDPEKKADAIERGARELANLIALGNGHKSGYKGLPEDARKRLDGMKPEEIRRAVLADVRPDLATVNKGDKSSRLDSMTPAQIQTVLEAELSRPTTTPRGASSGSSVRTDGAQVTGNPADRYAARHKA